MLSASQLTPGVTISIGNKLYRVETCIKVAIPRRTPFIKAKLRELESDSLIEKNFKLDQQVKNVTLTERRLEFLYLEGKNYLFLDIGNLNQVLVPHHIIGDKSNYLKEGVEVKAAMYSDIIFSVELSQFLELMVTKVENDSSSTADGDMHLALLETGAKIEVPPFIEVGDIIKVDTKSEEYIQRM